MEKKNKFENINNESKNPSLGLEKFDVDKTSEN